MKSADERFDEKMDWIAKEVGIHPEMKLTLMAGPDNAQAIMNMMRGLYKAGIDDYKTGKVY